MRIMSVIGALALACLCFASPSIAASPADHVTFYAIGHEMAVVDAPADFLIPITAPAVDLTVPNVVELSCSTGGDGDRQLLTLPCTVGGHLTTDPVLLRIDDVGWRQS